jgi:hypothetical protein
MPRFFFSFFFHYYITIRSRVESNIWLDWTGLYASQGNVDSPTHVGRTTDTQLYWYRYEGENWVWCMVHSNLLLLNQLVLITLQVGVRLPVPESFLYDLVFF